MRYYFKESCKRYRIHDSSQKVGTNHMCIADCSQEWMARVIVHEMNNGLPYRPDITYSDYVYYFKRRELVINEIR